jgi:NTP pyrophosphatase (non-canonical NTP hydrolase)
MKNFELGQVVKIVNEEVARDWFISKFLGVEFEVDNLSGRSDNFEKCTQYNNYFIPPEACELVKDQYNALVQAANLLRDACFNASFNAGWWHDADGKSTLDNPLTVSNKLMLIVSEVVEAMEGDRKDAMDDKLPHRKMIEVELADAVIRICDLAGALNLDIGGAIAEKMSFNSTRPDHKKENRAAKGGKKY